MKGPRGRWKFDLRRTWHCPLCQKRAHTGGQVASRACVCSPSLDAPNWMVLHEENLRPFQRQSEPRPAPAPFPAYSYVPGLFPHPYSDPAGHSFGKHLPALEVADPENWQDNTFYVRGLELFNHGYYWEAHEFFEKIWVSCGRQGITASFMKGLIQLAVAGIKIRERRPEGITLHARRGAELFREVLALLPTGQTELLGLNLLELINHGEQIGKQEHVIEEDSVNAPSLVVFPFQLQLKPPVAPRQFGI